MEKGTNYVYKHIAVTQMYMYVHVYKHTCVHMLMCSHSHTHTHTHTHTHIQKREESHSNTPISTSDISNSTVIKLVNDGVISILNRLQSKYG